MHQARENKMPVGGGYNNDSSYLTWELKECPACGKLIVEYYAAIEVISAEEAKIIAGRIVGAYDTD